MRASETELPSRVWVVVRTRTGHIMSAHSEYGEAMKTAGSFGDSVLCYRLAIDSETALAAEKAKVARIERELTRYRNAGAAVSRAIGHIDIGEANPVATIEDHAKQVELAVQVLERELAEARYKAKEAERARIEATREQWNKHRAEKADLEKTIIERGIDRRDAIEMSAHYQRVSAFLRAERDEALELAANRKEIARELHEDLKKCELALAEERAQVAKLDQALATQQELQQEWRRRAEELERELQAARTGAEKGFLAIIEDMRRYGVDLVVLRNGKPLGYREAGAE